MQFLFLISPMLLQSIYLTLILVQYFILSIFFFLKLNIHFRSQDFEVKSREWLINAIHLKNCFQGVD